MDGKFWANVILCCLMLIVCIAGVNAVSSSSITEILQPDMKMSEKHGAILDKLIVERNGFRVKRASNQVDALFSIDNSSDYDVNNIVIKCRMADRSGRSLGNLKWFIGETVERGMRRTVQIQNRKKFVPMVSFPIQYDCQVVGANVVSKPFIQIKNTHESVSHRKTETKRMQTGDH